MRVVKKKISKRTRRFQLLVCIFESFLLLFYER